MRLIVRDRDQGIVGVIEEFTGAIPREGEYIFHPNKDEGPDATIDPTIHTHGVMSVKTVTHGILARPKDGEQHFIGRDDQVVEVTV